MIKKHKIKCAIFLPSLNIQSHSELQFYNKILQLSYLKITCIYIINKKKIKQDFFFSKLLINIIKFIESKFIFNNSPIEKKKLRIKFLKKKVKNIYWDKLDSSVIDEISSNDLVLNFNNLSILNIKTFKLKYGIWSLSDKHADQNFLIKAFLRFLTYKDVFNLSLYVYKNKKNYLLKEFTFNKFYYFFQTNEFAATKVLNFTLNEIKLILEKKKFSKLKKIIRNNKKIHSPFILLLRYLSFKYVNALYQKIIPINLQPTNQKNYKWHLAIISGKPTLANLKKSKIIVPPSNEFWADPFIFKHKNEEYVFFENFEYKKNKGCIAVGKIKDNNLNNVRNVIECNYHLSYPYIYEYKNNIYLIPETHETRRLEIWKSIKFPYKWKLHKTLLHGVKIADTSIIEYMNEYWVFANISNDKYDDFTSELHIFKTNNPLLDKLVPHSNNPIILGSESARNGGQVYIDSNKNLIRPSQAYVNGIYGHQLNLNKIIKLNLFEYEEKIIRRIKPNFKKHLIGVHHISHSENKSVIDVLKRKN